MALRDIIYEAITSVAEQQYKKLAPLSDTLPIMDSGLDSLCIAVLVAKLDDELNLDPFEADDVIMPVTIGDLVKVYETAQAAAQTA
jgi:acyl carrier protein